MNFSWKNQGFHNQLPSPILIFQRVNYEKSAMTFCLKSKKCQPICWNSIPKKTSQKCFKVPNKKSDLATF